MKALAKMRLGNCLFSAPASFLPKIQDEFQALMPTKFVEVWEREQLQTDPTIVAWVPNPGQRFTIDDDVLEIFPRLEVIVTPSTGRNHIDSESCARRRVSVLGLTGDREALEAISASAEFTFLLLLNGLRRLDVGQREVSARRWRMREDLLRGRELAGKRVGLVGFGRIGRRLARYCAAFDASVLYYDPYVHTSEVPAASLEEIFEQCDIVCICCALTAETAGMVNRPLLDRLKRQAVLVNTSRGEVINEDDLLTLLTARDDIAVALDVLTGEVTGTPLNSRLLTLHDRGRIVITPHVAGATMESQAKAAAIALDLLRKHLAHHSVAR